MENSLKGSKNSQNQDIKQLQRVQAILTGISFILFVADYPYTLGIEYLLVIFLGYGMVYFGLGFGDRTTKVIGIIILIFAAILIRDLLSYPARILALLIIFPVLLQRGIKIWG